MIGIKDLNKSLGFEELLEDVVSKGVCAGCGACFVVCPYEKVLEYEDEEPLLVGECKHCGICLKVCPCYNVQVGELEEFVFGRRRRPEESFGVNKEICVSRSTDKRIIEKCQDGGVVTTLLVSALNSGAIDSAIVSGIDPSTPWLPKPVILTRRDDMISCSGTRYTYSPSLIALKEAVSKGLRRIAFVGTPCQVLALRRMQKIPLKKYSDPIAFSIGLFCSECFSYEGLMVEKIQKGLGINLSDVKKVNIKGKLLVQKANGETIGIPLKEVRKYSRPECGVCDDFSAELADISAGGVGLDGWTSTVIRTDKGLEAFNHALKEGLLEVKPAEEFKSSLDLFRRLSESKRSHNVAPKQS